MKCKHYKKGLDPANHWRIACLDCGKALDGLCPVCGKLVAMRNDGRLWTHGGRVAFRDSYSYRIHCAGTGKRTDGAYPVQFVLEWEEFRKKYLARTTDTPLA